MEKKFSFGITSRRRTANANKKELTTMANADEKTHTSFTRLSRALQDLKQEVNLIQSAINRDSK